MQILELGTGCGIVGISIAQILPDTNVLLTDLPEAQEIVERNIKQTSLVNGSTLRFEELDWSVDLPLHLQSHVDLVLAADCTYNPDSRYACSELTQTTVLTNVWSGTR
jgi:methylase of polypeptide subunit release factors